MDTIQNLIVFFQNGGPFMYLILVAFLAGIFITLERYSKLASILRTNKTAWTQAWPFLTAGDVMNLQKMLGDNTCEASIIIKHGLRYHGEFLHRDDIDLFSQACLTELTPPLERRAAYITLLANVSTLLGLLGTIIGLIDAFASVANALPSEKSGFLSDSISAAMSTTAFGLVSAIVLLAAHAIIRTKIAQIISTLEVICVKTLNIISEHTHNSLYTDPRQ